MRLLKPATVGTNLEWVARAENKEHAIESGLHPKGAQRWNSTLNTKQVIEMRKRRKQGWGLKNLAIVYGTCPVLRT